MLAAVAAMSRDCAVWVIVRIRAARLGLRVFRKTWKLEPHSGFATPYYAFHVAKEVLLPLVLSLLLMLSGIFGLHLLPAEETGFHAIFHVAFDLLSRIPGSRVLVTLLAALILIWTFLRMGSFERMMLLASQTDEAATFLLNEMESGIKEAQIYSLLRGIYASQLEELNRRLALPDRGSFRFLDINTGAQPFRFLGKTVDPTRRYAAVYAPLEDTNLSELATSIDGVGLSKLAERIRRLTDGRQKFVQRIRWINSGRQGALDRVDVDSGSNFVVRELRNKRGKLELIVGTAEYGDIMRTCDCLVEEITLLGTVLRQTAISARAALWLLPIRRLCFEQEGLSTFVKPTFRRAGLGVAALTVLKDKEGYSAQIGRRSRTVSTYMNAWHVIPAGMCNTRDVKFGPKFLRTNITCEFFEELFSQEEFEKHKSYDWEKQVNNRAKKIITEAGLGRRDFGLIPTALCIDLLNLRPEVCVVIAIHNCKFLEKFADPGNNTLGYCLRPNGEYVHLANPEAVDKMRVEESVQSGACAYYAGLKAMAHFMN